MYWYIAMFFWAATMVNAYLQGATKLAFFALFIGLGIIFLVYFKSLGAIGMVSLSVLAIFTFLAEKIINIKSH